MTLLELAREALQQHLPDRAAWLLEQAPQRIGRTIRRREAVDALLAAGA